MKANASNYTPIPVSRDEAEIIRLRDRFQSPSLKTFQAYSRPLVLEKGHGQYLWDVNGKKYLDLMAQNLCVSVGYGHPLVLAAVRDQLEQLPHCTTMYFNAAPSAFGEELTARFPAGTEWVAHFVNSGAEAIDLALAMARLHTGNFEMLALRNAYHGLHFSAGSLTGIHSCRQPMPPAPGIVHAMNPDPYRGPFGDQAGPYLEELARTMAAATPGQVAGLMLEPIQGYGGVLPLPDGYMAGAAEMVHAAGGLLIVDEVQTGFTRTGRHYWAFEASGVAPDIAVLGKGIGNGHPLAAVVTRREIAESLARRKFFNTYGANPLSCAAGRAVLQAIDEDGLMENARVVGERLLAGLRGLEDRYPLIGDVRGLGLMIGAELVKDRETREPADELAGRIAEHARERGVIMGKGGAMGNVLRINPPLCITEGDADFVLEVLEEGFGRL